MKNQIDISNQNHQGAEKNQIIQDSSTRSEKQNKQFQPQQKFLSGIKLSKKNLLILFSIALVVLFVAIGLFWYNQKTTDKIQNLPNSSSILEWQVFRDEHVEYRYPKNWIQISEVPQQFQELVEFSSSCKALVFQDQNNQDIIFIVENYPYPLQSSLASCWSKGTLSTLIPSPRPIKIGEKEDKIYIMQLSSGSSNYVLERYGFESDYTTVNAYMLSIIFPQQYKNEVEPIMDEIIASFKYLNQYQVVEPKEWKTYTSKLGFSFEYPSDWGDVTEEISDAKTKGTGESGKTYSLSFSIKSNVKFQKAAYGAGRSFDYSAPRESIFTDYRGDPEKPASVTSEITLGLNYYCYQYPAQYYPYKGVIKFNLPGKEISGVMLVVPILSPADIEKYNKIVEDFINQEESCKNPLEFETESPAVIAKEKEIIEMLNNGVNFDKESQINLKIFKHISESAKIL